jgi:phage anti-repressor protein
MIKQFTRKQLQEQLGFDTGETKIILEYQKKLPVLVENDDIEGFCVNARDLHKQLEVSKQFSTWIKANLEAGSFSQNKDYEIKFFKENQPISLKEYEQYSDKKLSLLGVSVEYFTTINTAKEIAMFTGNATRASEKLKYNSKLARQYFILMEKAVRKNIEWIQVRNPEKEGYKQLCLALSDYMVKLTGHEAIDWDYRFEANALNVICTGFEAQEIRNYMGCVDKITRDSLTKQYNEYLYKLQEMDIVYLGMGLNRYQRYEMLNKTFDILYPDAQPLFKNASINKILENKKKLLEEVKNKVNDSTLPFGLSA